MSATGCLVVDSYTDGLDQVDQGGFGYYGVGQIINVSSQPLTLYCPVVNDSAISANAPNVNVYAQGYSGGASGWSAAACLAFDDGWNGGSEGGACGQWVWDSNVNNLTWAGLDTTAWTAGAWSDTYFVEVYLGAFDSTDNTGNVLWDVAMYDY